VISIEEACRLSRSGIEPLVCEQVVLDDALGRCLAQEVRAAWDLPPHDGSAVDGYAVRSADVREADARGPVRLEVVGCVYAGDDASVPVSAGTTVRITTGARIPVGADAVVRQEVVDRENDIISVRAAVSRGANVRRGGEDVEEGRTVLSTGTRIGPEVIAVLAAFGHDMVRVGGRPRVRVLPTGSELRSVGDASRHTVVDTNTPMICAMARDAGAIAEPLPIVKDERDVLHEALHNAAIGADVLITTGGASVGDRDFMRSVLGDLGATIVFWRVAVKPGKPVGFARLGDVLVFALPGNPGACRATFELLVKPALLRLQGAADVLEPTLPAILEGAAKKQPALTYFLRGQAVLTREGVRIDLSEQQSSGQVVSALGPNALAILPRGRGSFAPGDGVQVRLVGPLSAERAPPILCFVGTSGSGKTTLLSSLIARLCEGGLRVGALKHDADGFELDHEGKDTFRLRAAGAWAVGIASPTERAIVASVDRPATLAELVSALPSGLDLVLVEGYKHDHGAKVEVHRKGRALLCRDRDVDNVVAIASDDPDVAHAGLPVLDVTDLDGIEAFVRAFMAKHEE